MLSQLCCVLLYIIILELLSKIHYQLTLLFLQARSGGHFIFMLNSGIGI
jgi:hypothetical protein